MTEKRGGRANQSSRAESLGGMDPRSRRQPQSATTDLDLAKPLVVQNDGKVGLELTGALAVDSQGKLVIRVSNGLQVAPGSPVSLQLSLADNSMEITKDGRVQARPRTSQVIMDNAGGVQRGRTLKEVLDLEIENKVMKGASNGYCELDSSAMIPAARVPFSALPATIQLQFINDTTYNQNVVRFSNDGSGSAVNYVEFTNAATGVAPEIQVAGSDTNIGLDIYAKGTGIVRINGSQAEVQANKDAANGYCGLDGTALVSPSQLGTGVIVGTEFLRADQTYVLDSRSAEAYQHSGANGAGAVYYIANSVQNTALSTGAPSANTMRAVPFVAPARGGTISEVAFNVTAGVAGNCRVGIYSNSADDNLYPDALLFDSGSISVAANGVKTAAASIDLSPGRLYWAVIVGDAAPTIRTLSVNNCGTILGYGTAMGTAGNVGVSLAFTYAALPDPFGSGGAYITAAPVPALAYKV